MGRKFGLVSLNCVRWKHKGLVNRVRSRSILLCLLLWSRMQMRVNVNAACVQKFKKESERFAIFFLFFHELCVDRCNVSTWLSIVSSISRKTWSSEKKVYTLSQRKGRAPQPSITFSCRARGVTHYWDPPPPTG